MKKFYLFLSVMMLTLVSVSFVSCGDDKDEPKSSDLVGTWQVKAIAEDGESFENLVQFTKDGKWHSVDIYEGEIGVEVEVEHGTYTVSGNKMTVTYSEDGVTINEKFTFEVNGNKLTLTSDELPVAVIYDRVKDSVIEPYL